MHKAIEIKPGVFWVGAIDWNVRNFHGYTTQQGTTYNAYLIVDETVTLVDTVKANCYGEMRERIASVIDPAKVSLHVCNHIEPDHSGGLVRWMHGHPGTRIVCSKRGAQGLEKHYHKGWKLENIEETGPINIGKHTLHFAPTPMVHWPDSMVTYVPEAKLLLPNDAFGQHLATAEIFDDEVGLCRVMPEASKYYANIVMPFSSAVQTALDKLGGLDFDMMAPSHGVVWRSHVKEIIEEYKRWVSGEAAERVLVIYDTMWGSTHRMAEAVVEGARGEGVEARLINLTAWDRSDVLREVLEARAFAVGSPTLNNGLFPTVAAFMAYLKGLKPKNKIAAAFGSYGWSGEAPKLIDAELEAMKLERVGEPVRHVFVPAESDLEPSIQLGAELARRAKNA